MPSDQIYPVLVIVVRSDLKSMNPGKAAAQACHAANLMVTQANAAQFTMPIAFENLKTWQHCDKSFGTTLIKIGNPDKIAAAVDEAAKTDIVLTGEVLDPTYPVPDGGYLHLIPLKTCAYFFGLRPDVGKFTDRFALMP